MVLYERTNWLDNVHIYFRLFAERMQRESPAGDPSDEEEDVLFGPLKSSLANERGLEIWITSNTETPGGSLDPERAEMFTEHR